MAGVFQGRKNIEADGTGAQWQPNGNVVIDLGRYRNKRNLATILTLSGIITAKVTTAPTAEGGVDVPINYKDDHFFNLCSNVQVKLNGNTEVKNVTSLAIFRYLNVLQNRGKFEYRNMPSKINIPKSQTSAQATFELLVTIPYALFDMLGATQCNIPTWLFSSFQLTYKNEVQDVVFSQPTTAGQSLELTNAYVNCSAKQWITDEIRDSNPVAFAEKMGNLFVQKVISKGFSGGGKGQYVELTPNIWCKDYVVVFRNSQTNERLDDIVTRMKIADGNNILVDTTPAILKNDMMTRFSLSQALFERELADSPDGKGIFYGVYHIGTNYFGDMQNSLVFQAWNQPRLYIDFVEALNLQAGQEVLVEVYQAYEEQPQLLKQVAAAEANKIAQAQG